MQYRTDGQQGKYVCVFRIPLRMCFVRSGGGEKNADARAPKEDFPKCNASSLRSGRRQAGRARSLNRRSPLDVGRFERGGRVLYTAIKRLKHLASAV